MRTKSSLLTLGICAALAGCGGGSSGGSSNPPPSGTITITSTNYPVVAQQTLSGAFFLADSASTANGSPSATGVQTSSTASPVQFAQAQLPKLDLWFQSRPVVATGVITTSTVSCTHGGTIGVSINDANNSGALDAGDSFTLTMNNCQEGSDTMKGTLQMTINNLTGSPHTYVFSMSMTLTLTNLEVSNATTKVVGNGSMTETITSRALHDLSVTATTPALTLTSTVAGSTHTVSLSSYTTSQVLAPSGTGYTSTVSTTGNMVISDLGSDTLTVATLSPLVRVSSDAYPSSGQLLVSDAGGRKVRLTVTNKTSVLVEADADANGSYELSTTKLWSELL